jgi:hypothetical protein
MGVLEAILIILALKIPIVGLLYWVYTLMKEPEPEEAGPSEESVRKMPPRLPEPDPRPRKRGPHGGAGAAPPSPRRDPHPTDTPPAPVPASHAGREH